MLYPDAVSLLTSLRTHLLLPWMAVHFILFSIWQLALICGCLLSHCGWLWLVLPLLGYQLYMDCDTCVGLFWLSSVDTFLAWPHLMVFRLKYSKEKGLRVERRMNCLDLSVSSIQINFRIWQNVSFCPLALSVNLKKKNTVTELSVFTVVWITVYIIP